jgi:type II secretory pathway pseudopilin PulG
MIVLGILSAILVLGLPRLKFNQNNIKEVSRQMSVLMREIRNKARITGATHRLVFNISSQENREARNEKDTYWVEFAQGEVLAMSKEQMDARTEDREKNPETAPQDPFKKSDKFYKKDKELPTNLRIGSVETSSLGKSILANCCEIVLPPPLLPLPVNAPNTARPKARISTPEWL